MKSKLTRSYLLLLVSMVLFSKCTKDGSSYNKIKYCWKCTIRQATAVPGMAQYNTQSINYQEFCDATTDDVEATERAGTSTYTSTSNGTTITVNTSTTCERK